VTDINYAYFVDVLKKQPARHTLRVLDYGCGRGEIVRLLRSEGISAFGTDVSESFNRYNDIGDLTSTNILRPLKENGQIPYDEKFDIVFSNQVLEHVEDLDSVITHLKATLKSDGFMIHHIPTQETIREGHIGIPFSHWFPSGKLRFLYTYALRVLGFGLFKGEKSRRQWTKDGLEWIDAYCFYRKASQIKEAFEKQGLRVTHREMDYIRFRSRGKTLIEGATQINAFKPLYETLFRRLGFIAIEVRFSASKS
jgi:cyclopropane fatty-acyl-phospholipid synthase-like methyltransferase